MIYLSNKKFPNQYFTLTQNIFKKFELIKTTAPKIKPEIYYIGRPSILGNCYSHLQESSAKYFCGSREEAVSKYDQHLNELENTSKEIILINQIKEKYLNGINICLECWCVPNHCHGEPIIKKIMENK